MRARLQVGLVGLVGLALIAGCGKLLNADYCAVHTDDPDCRAAGLVSPDAAPRCTTDTACTDPDKGVCDLPSGTCVQCTQATNKCSGPTTVCSTVDTCVGCETDAQCNGLLCVQATNTCAAADTVLYVAVNGQGAKDCHTLANACTLQLALAAARADAKYRVIKMAAGDYSEGTITLDLAGIVIQGSTVAGSPVTITSTTTANNVGVINVTAAAELDDVTVRDALNDSVIRCKSTSLTLKHVTVSGSNAKDGVTSSACTLTVDRSAFFNHVKSAIFATDSTISIRNSVFYSNGSTSYSDAAVSFNGNTTGTFRFNTLAFNKAHPDTLQFGDNSAPAAINCYQLNFGKTVSVTDNLFAQNLPYPYMTYPGGGCTNLTTSNNYVPDNASAGFASSTSPINLHLTTASSGTGNSAIRDNTKTNCNDLAYDIDGDTRPQNTACDYGADEFKP